MTPPRTDTSYRGPTTPSWLGEQVQLVLDLDGPPETFGDWIDALARIAERDGIELTPDVLCTTDDSPHLARFAGRTQHYACVQDPIVLPFLDADIDRVEIDTESPVSGTPITLDVTRSGMEADPVGTVFSFGVDATADGPPADGLTAESIYPLFCPYGHAFPSREEYLEWDDGVDAYTMTASRADTLAWARAIGSLND